MFADLSCHPIPSCRVSIITGVRTKLQSAGVHVKEGRAQTWSPCVRVLEGHTSDCYVVTFSPDGGRLVTGSGDHTIRLWNVQTGALLRVMAGHSSAVISLAYSPDGALIASGSRDHTIIIWDAVTGLQVSEYTGHSAHVWCITFSADTQHVASGDSAERSVSGLWLPLTCPKKCLRCLNM